MMPCFLQFNTLVNWRTFGLLGGCDGRGECRLKQGPSWAFRPMAPDSSQVCHWPSLDKLWEADEFEELFWKFGLGIWISSAARQHQLWFRSTSWEGRTTSFWSDLVWSSVAALIHRPAWIQVSSELPPEIEGWGGFQLPHPLSSLSLSCGNRTLKF